MKNPQLFQVVEQAQKNNSDPIDLFKQVTNNYTPEQMTNLFNRAKQFGVPDEVLQKLQNDTSDIDTKSV